MVGVVLAVSISKHELACSDNVNARSGVRAEAYRQFALRPEADHHTVTRDFLGATGCTVRLRDDVARLTDDGVTVGNLSDELEAEVVTCSC